MPPDNQVRQSDGSYVDVGQRLRELREERRMSLRETARRKRCIRKCFELDRTRHELAFREHALPPGGCAGCAHHRYFSQRDRPGGNCFSLFQPANKDPVSIGSLGRAGGRSIHRQSTTVYADRLKWGQIAAAGRSSIPGTSLYSAYRESLNTRSKGMFTIYRLVTACFLPPGCITAGETLAPKSLKRSSCYPVSRNTKARWDTIFQPNRRIFIYSGRL